MSTPNYFQMIITLNGDITSSSIPNDNHWTSMCSNGTTIIAVADSGINRSKISTDTGTTWTQYATSNDSNSWSSVCYDNVNNKYVAVAKEGTNKIMTSYDGISWAGEQAPDEITATNNTWSSISSSNGIFVAVADSGNYTSMSSVEGSWQLYSTPNDSAQWNSVSAGSNGMFVAVGSNSSMVSNDYGKIWTLMDSSTTSGSSICYNPDTGSFTSFAYQPPTTSTDYSIPFNLATSSISFSDDGTPAIVWDPIPSTLSCYNMGTPILCYINGIETYVPIENIKIGTLVKTLTQGYKPVELIGKHNIINNPSNEITSMYKMKNSNLILTGGHYLLVDELRDELIHNKTDVTDWFYKHDATTIEGKHTLLVCNSDLFEKLMNNSIYTILHLVLEGDNDDRYAIYADNVLSETTSKYHFLLNGFQNTG